MTGHEGNARGIGSEIEWRDIAVLAADAHARGRNAQRLGAHLHQHGVAALPDLGRTDHEHDRHTIFGNFHDGIRVREYRFLLERLSRFLVRELHLAAIDAIAGAGDEPAATDADAPALFQFSVFLLPR